MRLVRSSYCERASSGKITAAPPRSVMKSRRLIAAPDAREILATQDNLVKRQPMSALGQKQLTFLCARIQCTTPPLVERQGTCLRFHLRTPHTYHKSLSQSATTRSSRKRCDAR